MNVVNCPTCGAPRLLRQGDEGTSHFAPARGNHAALADSLDGYHAANLLEALKLVPDTGDWHGSLRFACKMALDREGDRAPKPNQTAEQMEKGQVPLDSIVGALRIEGQQLGDLTWNPDEPAEFILRKFRDEAQR